MDHSAFLRFSLLREELKRKIDEWTRSYPGLKGAQEALQAAFGHAAFPVETPIVYNSALDGVRETDVPRLILVADNPGIKEQLACNRSYLVGQSGKLASAFFKNALGIDFRKDVVILNKTPVHTPRTKELSFLEEFGDLLIESQRYMAKKIVEAASALSVPVWIIGYSELGRRGLFREFAEAYVSAAAASGVYGDTRVFRHFSMNQFSVDLASKGDPSRSVGENLESIGTAYRDGKLPLPPGLVNDAPASA